MNIRRTLTAALLAAATVLPVGAVAIASAPVAAAASQPSCNTPDRMPSRAEILVVEWYGDFIGVNFNDACNNDGRFYWVDQLNRGVPREQVLAQIVQAGRNPAYNAAVVRGGYVSYLQREPDSGSRYWVDGVSNGMAVEWFNQNLLASDEYASRSYSEANYISRLYGTILGRGVGSDGAYNYWMNRVRTVGRLNTVREIWFTQEAIDRRTNTHYLNILGRNAGAGELAYWRPFEAASDDNFPQRLAATDEYQVNYGRSYQYGPDWK